jgi:hypothetical protein
VKRKLTHVYLCWCAPDYNHPPLLSRKRTYSFMDDLNQSWPHPHHCFPKRLPFDLWDFNTNGLGAPWTYMTQGCAAKTCCPSGNVYTKPWAWMTSYYSPGVCPSQYRSCPGSPAPPFALSTTPGETIAFCCPTSKISP